MSAGTGRSRRSRVSLWLCVLSAAFILYGTTIPFRFIPSGRLVFVRWQELTLNPLYPRMGSGRTSIPDAIQNVLLFLPFGIFGAAAMERTKSSRLRVLVVTVAVAAL